MTVINLDWKLDTFVENGRLCIGSDEPVDIAGSVVKVSTTEPLFVDATDGKRHYVGIFEIACNPWMDATTHEPDADRKMDESIPLALDRELYRLLVELGGMGCTTVYRLVAQKLVIVQADEPADPAKGKTAKIGKVGFMTLGLVGTNRS